jgi:dCMP deaminase
MRHWLNFSNISLFIYLTNNRFKKDYNFHYLRMGVKNKIVAIVGLAGSGKTIAANFFVKKGYNYLRFGQITLDELKKRIGLRSDPSLEKEVREGIRKKHGMAAFAILNKPKIDKLLQKGNVVIDGMYSWSEYKYLKKIYGDNFRVLAVQASPSLRYKRLSERTEIDKKMIHRPFSFYDAMKRDFDEIENIEKGGPIAIADDTILNNSSVSEFKESLDGLFSNNKNKRPSWDEYFMKICSLVAERSTCLRHHVGCVIVKDKNILATGYNGAPAGTKDCLELGCLKDIMKLKSGKGHQICRATHAEQNAIIRAALNGVSIKGSTMYCTHQPCDLCARMIINSGIKRVVSYMDYPSKITLDLFKEAGIKFEKVKRPKKHIVFLD